MGETRGYEGRRNKKQEREAASRLYKRSASFPSKVDLNYVWIIEFIVEAAPGPCGSLFVLFDLGISSLPFFFCVSACD